jgi:hypothetical protein
MQQNRSDGRGSQPMIPGAREESSEVICYRLRCAESGNGLSHYVMYGDLPSEVVDE